ncbi:signal peptidase II [Trueperella bialowiezensis]|nr:signal peptidase II [Trueperella bialowiezensis]
MKKLAFSLILGLLVIVADQATKQWALGALSGGRTMSVIGDFLSFKLAFNSGAAFSFGSSTTWIFTAIAAVVAAVLPYAIMKSRPAVSIVLGIVWGGAVGNLIDRLVREPGFPEGHVVDFINYNGWFIGNVADIALVGGLAALFLIEVFQPDVEPAADVDRSADASDLPDAHEGSHTEAAK